MKKITIEITKEQGDLVMPNYPHQLYASNEKSNRKYDLEILDVDKFREFLRDECGVCFRAIYLDESEHPFNPQSKYYEGSVSQKHDNLKSILSKLDKAV